MEPLPSTLSTSRTYFLVCGIVNLAAGAFWATMTLIGGLVTCGLGCLLIFLPMIHLTVMIFDFVAASRFSSPPTPGTLTFLKLVAVMDVLAGLAIVPLVLGILNLLLLTRPEVYAHFHRADRM